MAKTTLLLLAGVGLGTLVASDSPPAQAADTGGDVASWMSEPLDAAALGITRGARASDGAPAEDGRMRLGVVLFDELETPRPPPPRGNTQRTAVGGNAGTATFRSGLSNVP